MSIDASPERWTGRAVLDADRHRIGVLESIHTDDLGRVAWLEVRTGMFGTRRALVPADRVRLSADRLLCPFERESVMTAPDTHAPPTLDEADRLREHYGAAAPATRHLLAV